MHTTEHNKQIYIYTKRRYKIANTYKYIGMIPKLFNILYQNNNDVCNPIFCEGIKFMNPDCKILFSNLLDDPRNYIYQSNLFTSRDIDLIRQMNLDKFNDEIHYCTHNDEKEHINTDNKQFDILLEHLFRGHPDMEYGLYFSLTYAVNDEEFENIFNKSTVDDENQQIIYYTTLVTLLEYVGSVDKKLQFDSTLVFYNNAWNFGKKTDTTVDMTRSQNKLNTIRFMEEIKKNIHQISQMTN